MLGFLKRIPELLGLRTRPDAKAPRPKLVAGGKADNTGEKVTPRGRGTGRGVTPPKRVGSAGPKSRKK